MRILTVRRVRTWEEGRDRNKEDEIAILWAAPKISVVFTWEGCVQQTLRNYFHISFHAGNCLMIKESPARICECLSEKYRIKIIEL